MTTWNENRVAAILARNTFANDLCVIPNCMWTGDEKDLLVVTPDLRIIDVEIKVTRADLRADAKKSKWWRQPNSWGMHDPRPDPVLRSHPPQVWKHYYAMPAEVWREDFLDLVQPASGVLLVADDDRRGYAHGVVNCVKRSQPNRSAQPIDAVTLARLARLTSLRLWDAYRDAYRDADVTADTPRYAPPADPRAPAP